MLLTYCWAAAVLKEACIAPPSNRVRGLKLSSLFFGVTLHGPTCLGRLLAVGPTWIFEIKMYDLDISIKYNVHILRFLPNLHSSLYLSFAPNKSLFYPSLFRVRLKLPNIMRYCLRTFITFLVGLSKSHLLIIYFNIGNLEQYFRLWERAISSNGAKELSTWSCLHTITMSRAARTLFTGSS